MRWLESLLRTVLVPFPEMQTPGFKISQFRKGNRYKFNRPHHPACDLPLSAPQVLIREQQGISKVKEAPKAPR